MFNFFGIISYKFDIHCKEQAASASLGGIVYQDIIHDIIITPLFFNNAQMSWISPVKSEAEWSKLLSVHSIKDDC